jgi:hypothetical protein
MPLPQGTNVFEYFWNVTFDYGLNCFAGAEKNNTFEAGKIRMVP